MSQLKDTVKLRQEIKLCKLNRFLYGLKDTPKNWHTHTHKKKKKKIEYCMIGNGYKSNECEKCIYFKS